MEYCYASCSISPRLRRNYPLLSDSTRHVPCSPNRVLSEIHNGADVQIPTGPKLTKSLAVVMLTFRGGGKTVNNPIGWVIRQS
jgi:hypothetical protein